MGLNKLVLSGCVSGQPILVTATATPGTTIHTATSSTSTLDSFDEIYIEAGAVTTTAATLCLQIGSPTYRGSEMFFNVPGKPSGLIRILDGHLLQNGLVVTATCSTASILNITGWVNRFS